MSSFLSGDPILEPHPRKLEPSQLKQFERFCEQKTGRTFPDYAAFDRFAVDEYRRFWSLFLDWAELIVDGSADIVCTDDDCERALFFPDLRLSYAETLLRIRDAQDGERIAVSACHADRPTERFTKCELRDRVAALAVALSDLGLGQGDRAVAVVHNDADAVVAALAVLAVGATLSTAAPDMGSLAVLSRFEQLEPKLFLASLRPAGVSGTLPFGERVAEVARGLATLTHLIAIDDGPAPAQVEMPLLRMSALIDQGLPTAREFAWPRFPFNHPLFILFSSGTTGPPKCIVHGAGGTLLEHVKEHRLHGDLRPDDTLFFQTSAAWMMWNWQLSALACDAKILTYDGPIGAADTLWRIVADERVTVFGTSPPYLQLCEETGFSPRAELSLEALRIVQSTGSILRDRQYDWVYQHVGPLPVQSISGGTDIIGCFVLGNPDLPVFSGESQCRSLGLDVRALGSPIGELVCCNPFPSRPLGFYGDPDGKRFHEAYFSQNAGVWTHGDLIEFKAEGSARMHGRSDGVMNIRGIRIGPAEIYRVLEDIPEIREALAVGQDTPDSADGTQLVLLVVMREPGTLDMRLMIEIRRELALRASRAHVPARILEVEELPLTHSGKRSESAARDAINGRPVSNAAALKNPDCVEPIRRAAIRPVEQLDSEPEGTAEASPDEKLIGEIWERMLGIAPIGMHDNFFDLGGTSLLAVRVVNAVCERFGVELPLTSLFEVPTIAGMAGVIRKPSPSPIEPYPGAPIRGPLKRKLIDWTARALAAPLVALHHIRIVNFNGGGQMAALVPGTLGLLVRRGWYRATLERCGEISVGFGSVITQPRARIGDRCTIESYCMIGWVEMEDDVMVSTHTVILGGPRQHGFADPNRPMRSQPGTFERVTIGSDVWLGAGSIVMAHVAPHTIVAAGATVTRTYPPNSILGGAPAQVTGNRLTESAQTADSLAPGTKLPR